MTSLTSLPLTGSGSALASPGLFFLHPLFPPHLLASVGATVPKFSYTYTHIHILHTQTHDGLFLPPVNPPSRNGVTSHPAGPSPLSHGYRAVFFFPMSLFLTLTSPITHTPGQVDGLGAAVVVASTAGGAVVGGYNPEGWIGLGEDRASNGAFLFTWRQGNIRSGAAVKLAKVGIWGFRFMSEASKVRSSIHDKRKEHGKMRHVGGAKAFRRAGCCVGGTRGIMRDMSFGFASALRQFQYCAFMRWEGCFWTANSTQNHHWLVNPPKWSSRELCGTWCVSQQSRSL